MKRILSVLLIALLLISAFPAMAEEKMAYIFTAESGKVGDTVKITVSVKNAPEIISYQTTLLYDSTVLEPTGQYQKMNMGGMMVFNPKAPSGIEGKGAVKAAAIGTSKTIIKGDMDLFNFSFKIIGECADEKGSLIEISEHSFSKNDAALSKVPSLLVQPCRVIIESENAPETNDPNQPADPQQPDAPSQPEPAPEQPSEEPVIPEEETPTGDWIIVPDENQAVHIDKDETGKEVINDYTIDYEKDESGKTTGVILYDKDKNEVGKLEVEEDEYGNLTVIKQKMNTSKPWYFWVLLGVGGAVLIAGITCLILFSIPKDKKKKKKKKKKK